MDLSEYTALDATALATLVRAGEVGPDELADLARRAMERTDPQINALVEWFDDPGPGRAEGPLAGVPFLLKDLSTTCAGRRLEMGSRQAQGYIAPADSLLVQRWKQAGARLLGRTNTPEYGICGTTEPLVNGPTRNPWALDRTAGGSSGGSAAAVAAGVVPVAHASDGGGSIRIPASCCGLVGLKVSRGRGTSAPNDGERLLGLAVNFVVARSVRDAALHLDVVSPPAPGDPFEAPGPSVRYADLPPADPGLRIGVLDGTSWPTGPEVHPEVAAAVHHTAAALSGLGHRVEEAAIDFDPHAYNSVVVGAFSLSAAATADWLAATTGRPPTAEYLEPITLAHIEHGRGLSGLDTYALETRANAVRRQVARCLGGFDAVVTPTIATLPIPLGLAWGLTEGVSAYDWALGQEWWIPFTAVFNVTGQPAISLPLAMSAAGLPIGVQLVAGYGREDLLIRLARQLEEALPWAGRRPPVHAAL
jgi:amidase